ncbi:MAG: metal-sensing transcriptional repressor [Betaproteobacteria bacterium]|nr:metal-sensing transcriptional repressor [Betaproteobacteria bacterium]MBI2959192.1 metal-sensing transcriptional repressor [Betaproteobacteria bacterium]
MLKHLCRTEHKQGLILRLKRVEGQLRGLQRLIEDEASCEAIAQQLSASRRALDKAYHTMVGCMIEVQLMEKGVAQSDVRPVVEMLSRYG